ncbi:hypothetical protein DF027_21325 [Burkholderia cenocepacia]|uniref:hypothetical protein n=1 Tax=Burkholderia cenocepacia TaxID=95486 RepID=UPI000F57E9E1|nr:hypothetical protein [Burkholderia cenocepacia]RQV39130.1 hypothetical protein DF027_21325 [Burkholderia cenocepacia]RQV41195.1 hypothetical protein DF028_14220 [Burkholderia cenocepacia]RQV78052.1 hypothetical protein DF010_14625 [Burkholderia cenocepacia]
MNDMVLYGLCAVAVVVILGTMVRNLFLRNQKVEIIPQYDPNGPNTGTYDPNNPDGELAKGK